MADPTGGIVLKAGVPRVQSTGPLLDSINTVNALSGAGPPTSGTTGTGVRSTGDQKVVTYTDTDTGATFFNEGSATSPYWSPFTHGGGTGPLWGVFSDFRDKPATALSDTTAALFNNNGLRAFGQGMTETDAGVIANSAGEGGVTLRMTTTDEVAHTIAIGGEAGIMQPDQHQLLVVDVEMTNVSAITLRGMGVGFVGLAADAFDPPITCATTVATLVQDDLCLMHFNVGYTATDVWKVAYNKSDAAASMTAVSTGVTVAAAATYSRLRVEIAENGDARFFINKAEVATPVSIALDVDEECSPIFYIESTSTAVKSCDVRRYAHWAYRP